MTAAEKVEIALIPAVGIVVFLMTAWLPKHISTGSFLLGSSTLVLFQGLIRDLWLISKRKRQAEIVASPKALCMCVESTVGITGVAAGCIMLGSVIDLPLSVSPWMWSAFTVVVLFIGFAIKDLVFEWRPFRIRSDQDHVNIIFSWKK